jgi:outer membrane receptor for ferric coprogen and ferric-rhodotorulic acid
VDPLKTDLQEIGLKQEWLDKRLYSSIAIFRIEQSNQLTADPTDLTGLRQLQVGRQRNQGLEVELKGELLAEHNLMPATPITMQKSLHRTTYV